MQDIEQIQQNAQVELAAVADARALEEFRIKYLGKKGLVQEMYAALAAASKEDKPLLGKNANILKNALTQMFEEKQAQVAAAEKKASNGAGYFPAWGGLGKRSPACSASDDG